MQPAARGRNPFDADGVVRGPDGIARYRGRPESLVHMLDASVWRDRKYVSIRDEPLPRNPGGKVLKKQLT